MATDYRYNQFDDVLEPVTVTEVHVIPSESPYVVTLGEVPLRADPSTIVVEEIKFSLVDGTYDIGRQYTEVAETPTSLQFRPDYNTGADGDKNWNTGTLLFSADNAHYTVRITYQATGTVASARATLHPQWWFERGGGSDGDFTPTANVTISGEKNYRSVYIPADVTVTVDHAARIKCQGSFINFGTILAKKNKNYDNGYGYVSLGGAGGNGYNGDFGSPSAGFAAPATKNNVPMQMWKQWLNSYGDWLFAGGGNGGNGGTGGGTSGEGGAGGGAIMITANEVYNTGKISADGENGNPGTTSKYGRFCSGSGGGGGGGTVVIIARRITNGGSITAAGGKSVNGKITSSGAQTVSEVVGADGGSGQIFTWEVDIK